MKAALLVLSLLCAVNVAGAEEPVYFADANLKAAVESSLGVSNPTPTQMLELTYLWVTYKAIANPAGLEYATNLSTLGLGHNALTGIGPLAGLTHLEVAYLDSNKISDVSPLAGLSHLRELRLQGNSISNLAPLAGLTSLRILALRVNSISNISVLAGLSNLETLHLEDNQISDLSPLSGLTNLTELRVGYNQISSLAPLSGLSNLRYLDAHSNHVSNLSSLAGLVGLEELILNDNQISDITPLVGLPSLSRLELQTNPLNPHAYSTDLPQIIANHPGIYILYDGQGEEGEQEPPPPPPVVTTRYLTVSAAAGGAVLEPGEGRFPYSDGASVRLHAQANSGFVFAGWSGTYPTNANPVVLTMNQDHQMQANFVAVLSALHVDDDAPGDPAPGDPTGSDPQEDGSAAHPFDSIQQAIETAAPGDSILVHPGTYRENIDLLGKDLHLTGTAPGDPAGTGYPVLEGAGKAPTVSFCSGESPACTFIGFVLTRGEGSAAGALYCAKSDPTIAHCLIVGNRSRDPNGAAAYFVYSRAVLTNCTIADNYAGRTGAGLTLLHSDVVVNNCILWGNSPQDILVLGTSRPALQYCDVPGAWAEAGDFAREPLFARPGWWADANDSKLVLSPEDDQAVWMAGDYHLQAQAGRWDPETRTWVQDKASSPCLDAGDPADPVGDEPPPNGGRLNLGVYGGTSEAGKSLLPNTPGQGI
jgi:hypothetical protein